ncbi:hypothetical protein PG997_013041 [Apiospora hydei]|uniref:Uncharacterized protein n=1 Tax=Apiospora hydei TaxID=1337664 RepID=A0ABR1V518_9PEZI
MGILRATFKTGLYGITGGLASVGAGMAYLGATTSIVDLKNEDAWFRSKTYAKYNPKANPALQDDCIKRVPLSKIRPELRNDEAALTLEFCRFWPQSKLHERYDAPPGSEGHTWETSELAVAKYEPGLKFVNHFEVVENQGNEITVRCGGSPLQPGLRNSDGLILFSARIDREKQEAVFSLKSALFDSAGSYGKGAGHPIPPKIVFLHPWYVRILTHCGVENVKA